ncbi:hypothetical protein ACFOPN_01580 [Xanthomonas hyacinthi]|uniref:hypothetical protein n=1 Tax=Xanthomonas hyacinthi TaxID=56455 RepID=UPI001303BC6E|nr:hypothetical protein [Xanthomonas hyacinthi]
MAWLFEFLADRRFEGRLVLRRPTPPFLSMPSQRMRHDGSGHCRIADSKNPAAQVA